MEISWHTFHQGLNIRWLLKQGGAQRDGRGAAAASQQADIEQLSRPRQQMSAYNCTRPRDNRNSARYETTRRI